ncbi:glycolipid anchored surface protein [Diaporthe helianthi]|uniref:1,3-beta-glucanosyltransferase n=1 Tax=Diaporthe helianthi TaxID=158607 RepID=A0A2P5HQ49_DIAHE|nr:glycolipid anchored surface protein [Diaporthe helianthi]
MNSSIRPVTIEGRYFWQGASRFLVKGIVYQLHRRNGASTSDPLADDGIEHLLRDLEAFKELGLNTLFVFQIDPTKSHDAAMKLLEDAGIYVLVICINRMAPSEMYTEELLEHFFSAIDCMAAYPNTLGVLVGNEVINDHNSTAAASVIRAVTRDVKKYMTLASEASEQRILPVGYSAVDVIMLNRSTFDYLTAGSREESIDFYCVRLFSDTDIPVFFSEYGANTVGPRLFHETRAMYSSEMTHVFSGGCVYEFYQSPSGYGIVELTENFHGTMSLHKSTEFNTLKKRLLECVDEQPETLDLPAPDQAEALTRPLPMPYNFWRATGELPISPVNWEEVRSRLHLSSWVILDNGMQRR